MTLQEIIEFYQPAVVQIATRTGTGTGFYLRDYDLIVTNNHVVRDLPKALIKGRTFPRQVSRVVYADERHDLAFLLPPADTHTIPDIHLGDYSRMKDGDRVLAIGHPYGLNYTATEGVISRVSRVQTGLRYIQIDAAINPGNSGGPLVNDQAEVIGVNTFIIKGGDNLGFALPVLYLKEALDLYAPVRGTEMTLRCPSCGTLVTRAALDSGKYCPECGTEITFPSEDVAVEEPLTGIAKTIEDILRALGKDPEVARTGQNRWQVEEGSAKIRIFYNPETYFIVSDAYLCRLPRRNIAPLYVYLLRENNDLHGQYFSLQGENILLSSTINNLELTVESGVETFRQLFAKADAYDGVLMDQYGCEAILEEE